MKRSNDEYHHLTPSPSPLESIPKDILYLIVKTGLHGQIYALAATTKLLRASISSVVNEKDNGSTNVWRSLFDRSFDVLLLDSEDPKDAEEAIRLFLWMLPKSLFLRERYRILGIIAFPYQRYSFLTEETDAAADKTTDRKEDSIFSSDQRRFCVVTWGKEQRTQTSDGLLLNGMVDDYGSVKKIDGGLSYFKAIRMWWSGIKHHGRVFVTDDSYHSDSNYDSKHVKIIKSFD